MAEIMIKAAGFVFVIIIAFILKQVHVLEKRDGLTIATIIMNVTLDRKSTRLNSSHIEESRMPSSA